MPIRKVLPIIILISLVISACGKSAPTDLNDGLKVVSTSSIIGDVVSQVGGDLINLTVLFPPEPPR